MEYLPAISILLVFLVIVTILLLKLKNDELLKLYEGKNFFLLGSLVIIFLLISFHLFKAESWTADLLKIAIGVFVGAGSIALKEKKSELKESSVNMDGSTVHGDVAGRDINKRIQNIDKAISDIKDSVVNQNNKFEQHFISNRKKNHIIHMIYHRNRVLDEIQAVVTHWMEDGWVLQSVTNTYDTLDGLIMIFTKESKDITPSIEIYRDSNFEKLFPRK